MKTPKMWKRTNGGWYVTINQEQISLGSNEEKARVKYERLMGAGGFADVKRVDDLLDIFLEWVDHNLAPATLQSYGDYLRSFNDFIPKGLRLRDLKPFHVSRWLDKKKTWNTTTKNGAVRALKRALNWAVEPGLISHSPIAHFKAPQTSPRGFPRGRSYSRSGPRTSWLHLLSPACRQAQVSERRTACGLVCPGFPRG